MASPEIAKELQQAICAALAVAQRRGHELLTLEHLLLALLDEPQCIEVLAACSADRSVLREQLASALDARPSSSQREPQQTIGVERVLQRAAFHAASIPNKFMTGGDVLVAMLREEQSDAFTLLQAAGVKRLEVLNFLAHGIRRGDTSFPRRFTVDLEENELNRKRSALEGVGRTIIDLTVTNPTEVGLSPTGITLPVVDRYQPEAVGLRSAREAVGRHLGVAPDRIVLSASTSEAYSWLLKLYGSALVPAPGYPLVEYIAQLENVEVAPYALRYDGRWCTDAPVVAQAGTERTGAVIAVSPGNPTGTYLAEHEARALAELCAERGWVLIIDEVFAEPSRSLAREWPCLTFTLGGLSKSCGLPQLKLAWMTLHGPGAERALDRLGLVADTYLSVGSPVQHAVGALLEQHAAPFRARVAERCATHRALLASRLPADWQLLGSEGGWSAVIRVPESLDEETRCLELLERGVAVHPGYFYDFPSGAHLVLSLLPEPSVFAAGVTLLGTSSRT